MPAAAPRHRGGDKPLDAGTGTVCASFGSGGRWLALATTHVEHGFIELNALPQFDAAWRTDPQAVRRYRALMTEDRHAFLSCEPSPAQEPISQRALSRPGQLVHRRNFDGWVHHCTTVAAGGASSIRQHHVLRVSRRGRAAAHPAAMLLTVSGRLDRPALAEITEVAPVPPTSAQTYLSGDGGRLSVAAPALPAEAVVSARRDDQGATWQIGAGAARLMIAWPAESHVLRFEIECALRTEPGAGR